MWAYLALTLSAATIALTVYAWRLTKQLSAPPAKLRPRANPDFDFEESLRRNIARFPKTLARLAEDD